MDDRLVTLIFSSDLTFENQKTNHYKKDFKLLIYLSKDIVNLSNTYCCYQFLTPLCVSAQIRLSRNLQHGR